MHCNDLQGFCVFNRKVRTRVHTPEKSVASVGALRLPLARTINETGPYGAGNSFRQQKSGAI